MPWNGQKHHLKHLYHSPIWVRGQYPYLIPEYTYQNTENMGKMPFKQQKKSEGSELGSGLQSWAGFL